ncbi:MAG: hypothetical protein ACXABI_02560 [Candidatus Hodarchaeales archaeon]|jgi:hypothetical protein
MNQPLDQVSGRILIRGRSYSAKEVIRGLLEQGIAINEKTEGLRIGFKLISPESFSSSSPMNTSESSACPFHPLMTQLNEKINMLTETLSSNENFSSNTSYADNSLLDSSTEDPPPPTFSPFSNSPFQSPSEEEKDSPFPSGSTFMDKNRKCSSCGSLLPSNAFFCNKCGSHVRSG